MTQPNICKCGHERKLHINDEDCRMIFEKKKNHLSLCKCTSFTPEKESQSSMSSLTTPESREHTLSCNVEKLSISQDSSKSGTSILTGKEGDYVHDYDLKDFEQCHPACRIKVYTQSDHERIVKEKDDEIKELKRDRLNWSDDALLKTAECYDMEQEIVSLKFQLAEANDKVTSYFEEKLKLRKELDAWKDIWGKENYKFKSILLAKRTEIEKEKNKHSKSEHGNRITCVYCFELRTQLSHLNELMEVKQ